MPYKSVELQPIDWDTVLEALEEIVTGGGDTCYAEVAQKIKDQLERR